MGPVVSTDLQQFGGRHREGAYDSCSKWAELPGVDISRGYQGHF